jgi:hypothetical protein
MHSNPPGLLGCASHEAGGLACPKYPPARWETRAKPARISAPALGRLRNLSACGAKVLPRASADWLRALANKSVSLRGRETASPCPAISALPQIPPFHPPWQISNEIQRKAQAVFKLTSNLFQTIRKCPAKISFALFVGLILPANKVFLPEIFSRESLTNPLTIPGQTRPKESTKLLQATHKYQELTCRKMATTRQEFDSQDDCYCRIAPCPAPQESQTKVQSCLQTNFKPFQAILNGPAKISFEKSLG